MYFHEFTSEGLREIILGKVEFKKCLCCDNNGKQYSNDDGCPPLPYPHPDWGDDVEGIECENCEGVGFVRIAKL